MRRAAIRWYHEGEEGLGLVEVIIAVFILSVSLLAMASVGMSSLTSLRISRDREHATNAASAAIEDARARDFGDLAHAATADLGSLPPEVRTLLDISSGCAQGEPPVRDAASADPVPLERTVGVNGTHQLYTVVTWEGEACSSTTAGDIKRVVTLTTWRDAGRLHSVRNETLVAPAGRGLPVPDFEVKPAEASLQMTPSQVGSRRCVEQQLRNLGSSDRYEWELVSVDGMSGSPVRSGSTGWRTSNGKWSVEAFLEHPPPDEARGGLPPSSTTALMTDVDSNGRPESDTRVASGERATVTFCYAPTAVDAGDFTANIDVVSRFDERRRERVVHQVSIGDAGVRLHLQDRDDTVDHPREDGNGNVNRRFPPYAMNPLNPSSEDRSQLLAPALGRWSTDVPASLPGMRLRRALLPTGNNQYEPAQLRTIDYRYQLSSPRQLLTGGVTCAGQDSASACLELWTAPPAALGDTSAGTLPAWVHLRVEFDVMDGAETGRIWPTDGPITTELRYQHTTSGWQRSEVPLNFSSGTALQTNQRLRIRVTCLETSTEDCALAYDTTDHPSNLLVRMQ